MKKFLTLYLISIVSCEVKAQSKLDSISAFHAQSFGIQGGLALSLLQPLALSPFVNLSYSKTIVGHKTHQLAFFPQFGVIFLKNIETKFLLSTSLQYKYLAIKRFETNVFLGINYQLRRLQYDRYQFEDNTLKNKGRNLHQFGPTLGINIGYKLIKKRSYSITPFLGFSLTKLNKSYVPNLFDGYKPRLSIGVNFNN